MSLTTYNDKHRSLPVLRLGWTKAAAHLAVDPVRSTAWTAATADEKGEYLVAATHRLDLLNWIGEPEATDQANEWPRTGLTYRGETSPQR